MAGDKENPTYTNTVNAKMTVIADAIRSKTGGTEVLTLDEMASGVNEVFEAGKKAEHDAFWEGYLKASGETGAFYGSGWHKGNFLPTKDFVIGRNTFYYHGWARDESLTRYDLAEHLENLGVKIIEMNHAENTFRYTRFTRIPELYVSKSTTFSNTFNTPTYMNYLRTIDKIKLCEGFDAGFSGAFTNCSNLRNIIFEGIIPQSISFSVSPLTVESMKSIISCLKDYSGTDSEFTYKVTFTSACITALEAEGATAEYNGESCTWIDLINYKKWNS